VSAIRTKSPNIEQSLRSAYTLKHIVKRGAVEVLRKRAECSAQVVQKHRDRSSEDLHCVRR